jgi:hypothetical protein
MPFLRSTGEGTTGEGSAESEDAAGSEEPE